MVDEDAPVMAYGEARESLQTLADKLAELLQQRHIRTGPRHIRISVGEMQQAVIDVEQYMEATARLDARVG